VEVPAFLSKYEIPDPKEKKQKEVKVSRAEKVKEARAEFEKIIKESI
jgi:hypothetical protein